MTSAFIRLLLVAGTVALVPSMSLAQTSDPCPRFPVGSVVSAPLDLYSQNGVLSVNLTYNTEVDSAGLTRFCFVTDSGAQSPTLHVHPGDELVVNVTNGQNPTAANTAPMPGMTMGGVSCTPGSMMTSASVNMHYHGTNVPPSCHQDEVISTMINAGETFRYDVHFPMDEPPGLYWYHPHIHGISEMAVAGGASGAIVVEGLQNINPEVAGLPQRLLVIRDNPIPGFEKPDEPAWDVSLNYVPIPFPKYTPAIITMKPGEKQFWRVVNASAGTIIDLQLQYDGVAQNLRVVGRDGVPTGSQDGTSKGKSINQSHLLLPPAGRAEFIVIGPSQTVKTATLMTLAVDTGPQGDYDPARPLASIRPTTKASEQSLMPYVTAPPPPARFAGLADAAPTATRNLYFSEIFEDFHSEGPTQFFITVEGQKPKLFDANNPPAITTTQGAVEDWTIQNRSAENHVFHIHQIHFLVLETNGKPVANGQYLDTINIPYWPGTGPYPSVKLRMDFRGQTLGDFVYHCHILEHEDGGMMAIIRVLPPATTK